MIAITGALGHIGSQLIRSLPDSIGDVWAVDNLSTQRYCSMFRLSAPNLRFIQGDARCLTDLIPNPPKVVIHLAAMTDAELSVNRSDEVHEANVEVTRQVVQACQEWRAKLIFTSTTSVYGRANGLVNEQSELHPQSPYARSKLEAEYIIDQTLDDYVILRLGTIVGPSPGMRFHTAVNKFIWQACVTKEPVTVWETAMDQVRPYCDLRDAIVALCHAALWHKLPAGTYNVVTSNLTVRTILTMIEENVALPGINLVSSPIMNQLSYKVSAAKIMAFGIEPVGNIAAAVRHTVKMLGGKL